MHWTILATSDDIRGSEDTFVMIILNQCIDWDDRQGVVIRIERDLLTIGPTEVIRKTP